VIKLITPEYLKSKGWSKIYRRKYSAYEFEYHPGFFVRLHPSGEISFDDGDHDEYTGVATVVRSVKHLEMLIAALTYSEEPQPTPVQSEVHDPNLSEPVETTNTPLATDLRSAEVNE